MKEKGTMYDTAQMRNCFLCVFPADRIPARLPPNFCLIANTDPAHKSRQHWVVLCRRGKVRYFFDSYGKKPSTYSRLWKKFDNWTFSKYDLQQMTSDICGDYCIYFCKAFCRMTDANVRPARIFANFDTQGTPEGQRDNDEFVWEVVHTEFPRTLNSTRHIMDRPLPPELMEVVLLQQLDEQLLNCVQKCLARKTAPPP